MQIPKYFRQIYIMKAGQQQEKHNSETLLSKLKGSLNLQNLPSNSRYQQFIEEYPELTKQVQQVDLDNIKVANIKKYNEPNLDVNKVKLNARVVQKPCKNQNTQQILDEKEHPQIKQKKKAEFKVLDLKNQAVKLTPFQLKRNSSISLKHKNKKNTNQTQQNIFQERKKQQQKNNRDKIKDFFQTTNLSLSTNEVRNFDLKCRQSTLKAHVYTQNVNIQRNNQCLSPSETAAIKNFFSHQNTDKKKKPFNISECENQHNILNKKAHKMFNRIHTRSSEFGHRSVSKEQLNKQLNQRPNTQVLNDKYFDSLIKFTQKPRSIKSCTHQSSTKKNHSFFGKRPIESKICKACLKGSRQAILDTKNKSSSSKLQNFNYYIYEYKSIGQIIKGRNSASSINSQPKMYVKKKYKDINSGQHDKNTARFNSTSFQDMIKHKKIQVPSRPSTANVKDNLRKKSQRHYNKPRKLSKSFNFQQNFVKPWEDNSQPDLIY